jgi:hypothetical protein
VHLISNDVIECNLIVESCEAGEWLMMPVMTDLVYQVTPVDACRTPGCASAAGKELKTTALADPVAVSNAVANLLVMTAGSTFLSVGNVSGVGEMRYGFSSTVEVEPSIGRSP